MDSDFVQYAFHDDQAAITAALVAAIRDRSAPLRLIGSSSTINNLSTGLQQKGYRVERVVWSYADPFPAEGLGSGILCEIPKTFDDWARCATITANGDIHPLWRLILPWSLLRETLSTYEYNAASFEELLRVYRGRDIAVVGRRSNQTLDRIEQFFPLRDKNIIEFGPSDGNHTADLLASGASHVRTVEGRPENVIKLLVAKYLMGWQNLDVVMDNFQLPGPWARQRYDLVYAQGVYYHCQNPLIFLDMLTQLSDAIFIGGWAATEDKPTSEWISLEHAGAKYRGKAYTESYHFLSGLATQSYMLECREIERFLAIRGFVTKYCDVAVSANGLSSEFVSLFAMKATSTA